MKTLFLSGFVLLSVLSCKKNNSGGGGNAQRISSISDGSQATIFEYDNQKRVTRIYLNASVSLKFTYSPAGVNIQRLGSGDMPDPDRKTDFSIVNGRIVNGTEFLPDKQTRRFSYGYDGPGRLIQVYVQLLYDGNTYESHNYKLTYDAQDNVTSISVVRKDNGGNDNSDSIYIVKSWYEKKFLTWNSFGFDYFGSTAFGQQHLGYGIIVPFNIAGSIYPGNHALKTEKTDNYYWNAVTKKWVFQSTNSNTSPESDYGYDANGRLVSYIGKVIEWQ